ncbi:MAG: hypothetical protein JXQ87_19655 [Bacteroidia bacterium]
METQLIPVIEITYYNETEPPLYGPYWEYEDDWEEYSKKRLRRAGFKDDFESFKKGSSFFEPEKISPNNLIKLIQDWFANYDGANTDDITPFYGGYVLNVKNDNVFFPQCCGDLSDIIYWRKLAYEGQVSFHHGHPEPMARFENTTIHFEFNESIEEFAPPTFDKLSIPKDDLKKAYDNACKSLENFEQNILTIFNELKIDIDQKKMIDCLIYKNNENK